MSPGYKPSVGRLGGVGDPEGGVGDEEATHGREGLEERGPPRSPPTAARGNRGDSHSAGGARAFYEGSSGVPSALAVVTNAGLTPSAYALAVENGVRALERGALRKIMEGHPVSIGEVSAVERQRLGTV